MIRERINLLPEEKIRLLNIERINAIATVAAIAVGLTLVGVIAALLVLLGGVKAGRDVLQGDIERSNREIATLNDLKDSPDTLEDHTRVLQSRLVSIKTILDTKEQVEFGQALQRLSQIVPPDVSFQQATIDELHVVTITGEARSFAAVGRFAEALKRDGQYINQPSPDETVTYFHDVQVTSSSLNESLAMVQYAITFRLGEETFNAGS